MADVSEEDRKLVTLARAARARSGAATGAALRDGTGRTYVGVDVALPSLRLSGLELCVAQAVAGGSTAVEAAAIVIAGAEATSAAAANRTGLTGPQPAPPDPPAPDRAPDHAPSAHAAPDRWPARAASERAASDRTASDRAELDRAASDSAASELAALTDLGGAGVPVLITDGRGQVIRTVTT